MHFSKFCFHGIFQIERNDTFGRFLVAQTDLQPGQLIFNELPMIVGPRQLTKPICLGCHKEISEVKYTCSRYKSIYFYHLTKKNIFILLLYRCGWPLCSQKCEDSPYHDAECRIIRAGGVKVRMAKYIEPVF